MKRILLYNWQKGIGDGIINSGYVLEIKKTYPEAEIDLVCHPLYSLGYKTNKYIGTIYCWRCYKNKILKNFLCQLDLLYKLRKNKYDLVLDINSSYQKLNFSFLKFIAAKENYGIYKSINKYDYTKNDLARIYDKLGTKSVYECLGIEKVPKYIFNMKKKNF